MYHINLVQDSIPGTNFVHLTEGQGHFFILKTLTRILSGISLPGISSYLREKYEAEMIQHAKIYDF